MRAVQVAYVMQTETMLRVSSLLLPSWRQAFGVDLLVRVSDLSVASHRRGVTINDSIHREM